MSANDQYTLSQGNAAKSGLPLRRNEQIAEILVFLLLVVPSMFLSLFLRQDGGRQQLQVGFDIVAVSIMLRDLSLVALILYFLWRNGEPISRIGWRGDAIWREVCLGAVLFVPFFFVALGVENLFLQLGFSQPPPSAKGFLKPHGLGQLVVAGALVAIVALTEETIFRGYLLLRFTAVSRSVVFAVLFSSLVFSMGHGYEGGAGVATTGVMGCIFAVIYLWRGSLVAPMIMHFLQDFLVIVVAAAVTGHSG